jgi:hypothetical protein
LINYDVPMPLELRAAAVSEHFQSLVVLGLCFYLYRPHGIFGKAVA